LAQNAFCVPVHILDSQSPRRAALTPTRDKAAQARFARRSAHSEHTETSAQWVQIPSQEGYARFCRDAE